MWHLQNMELTSDFPLMRYIAMLILVKSSINEINHAAPITLRILTRTQISVQIITNGLFDFISVEGKETRWVLTSWQISQLKTPTETF